MIAINHIRGLYGIMPNKVTVTLQKYLGSDSWESPGYTVPNSESRPLAIQEKRALEIEVTSIAKTWHLWVAMLGGLEPEPGDRILDANGGKWHVHAVDQELADQRFRCACVKERATS